MEKYKNKEWLENELKLKSVSAISDEYGYGENTIYRWMKKHGIEKQKPLYQNKEWLENELSHKGSTVISEELGVDIHTISRWIKKFGLTKEAPSYQSKEWLESKLKECNGSLSVIAQKYGYKRDTINEWCLKYGLTKEKRHSRTYTLNEDYFHSIDTRDKAYWLGLMMADGFVDRELYNFGIGLHPKDEYIIEQLRDALNSNAPIRDVYSGFLNEDKNNVPYKYLQICSSKMTKDLNYHGITPRKTGKECLPDTVPYHLIIDFIRGFIDGDGCISPSHNKIEVYSPSYNVLLSIKEFLEKELCIKEYDIKRKSDHDKPYFVYSVYSINAIKLGRALYEDADLYLTRKKELFDVIACKPRFIEI